MRTCCGAVAEVLHLRSFCVAHTYTAVCKRREHCAGRWRSTENVISPDCGACVASVRGVRKRRSREFVSGMSFFWRLLRVLRHSAKDRPER